jgi:hypothetical protein
MSFAMNGMPRKERMRKRLSRLIKRMRNRMTLWRLRRQLRSYEVRVRSGTIASI